MTHTTKTRQRRKRPFTPNQLKAFDLLRTTRLTVREIANFIDMHFTTVYDWIKMYPEQLKKDK